MVVNLGCFDLPGKDGPAKATFGGTYNFVVINQGGDAKVALAKEFVKNSMCLSGLQNARFRVRCLLFLPRTQRLLSIRMMFPFSHSRLR